MNRNRDDIRRTLLTMADDIMFEAGNPENNPIAERDDISRPEEVNDNAEEEKFIYAG